MEENMKQKIKKELKSMQDKKYKEFHKGLCPGTENIIGIRVPILRNYAKELLKQYDWKTLIKNIDNESTMPSSSSTAIILYPFKGATCSFFLI